MAGKNCKCVVCGLEYHNCSSCGTRDDNWSLNYPESSYCSAECYRKSEEYKKHAPLLLRLWESLSEEQQELLGEWLDTEDSDEIDEWRSKLFLAQQERSEDRAVETVKESLLETYEGFDIFEIKKTREYPNPELNEVLERQCYAVSKERCIKLPLKSWSTYKSDKDKEHVHNYGAPEFLSQYDLNNIYTVIDLIVRHHINFACDTKEVWKQCIDEAIGKQEEQMKPIENESNKAKKMLLESRRAKSLVGLDIIEEMREQ